MRSSVVRGTGGVVFPEIQYTTDGLAAIAAIIHQLAESNTPISALVKSMPSYAMCQKKLESPSQSVSEAVVQRAAADLREGMSIGNREEEVCRST